MTFKERVKSIGSKVWSYIKIARVELIVFAALLVVDLVTKAVVDATIPLHGSVTLIPHFLHFSYSHNKNAAFGSAFGLEKVLGELGVRIVLLIITALAMAFFAVFLYKIRGKHITGRLGLAMLISGALGNFIDRAILGYVRDFIDIEYFGLDLPWLGTNFATFNVADIGVTVGVVLFIIYILFFSDFGKDKKPKEEKSEYVLVDGDPEAASSPDSEVAADIATDPSATDIENGRSDSDGEDKAEGGQ